MWTREYEEFNQERATTPPKRREGDVTEPLMQLEDMESSSQLQCGQVLQYACLLQVRILTVHWKNFI